MQREMMDPSRASAEHKGANLLSLLLNGQSYGISMPEVCDIVSCREIAQVDDMSPFMGGIIPHGDMMIPVFDFRSKEPGVPAAPGDKSCVVVFTCKGRSYGLVMQKICEELRKDSGRANASRQRRKMFYWSESAGW